MASFEWMRRIANAVLDVILPRSARAMRTSIRTLADLPLAPSSHESRGKGITTLMDYHSSAVEDAVRTLKYDGSRDAARLLAGALSDYLREELASVRAFSPRPVLLVPVPLHPSRMRERGFNQIEHILRELPKEFIDGTLSRVAADALLRTRPTPQQTRLSREERLKNVAGAFAAGSADLARAHVILIDDVATTGATLTECARTLESAGARVALLALARA